MYKITEKGALNPTVTKMGIEAPLIANVWGPVEINHILFLPAFR